MECYKRRIRRIIKIVVYILCIHNFNYNTQAQKVLYWGNSDSLSIEKNVITIGDKKINIPQYIGNTYENNFFDNATYQHYDYFNPIYWFEKSRRIVDTHFGIRYEIKTPENCKLCTRVYLDYIFKVDKMKFAEPILVYVVKSTQRVYFEKETNDYFLSEDIEPVFLKKTDSILRLSQAFDKKQLFKDILFKNIQKLHSELRFQYQSRNYTYFNDWTFDKIKENLCLYQNTPKSVAFFNDLAYFLAENKHYNEAIFLLKIVTNYDSMRTVAYLNLGDALWDTGKQREAILNYKKYNEKMSYEGKSIKVPERVLQRISQKL